MLRKGMPVTYALMQALAKLAAEELLSLTERLGPFGLFGFSVGATASRSPGWRSQWLRPAPTPHPQSLSQSFSWSQGAFLLLSRVLTIENIGHASDHRLCLGVGDDLPWPQANEALPCRQSWAKGSLPASGPQGLGVTVMAN